MIILGSSSRAVVSKPHVFIEQAFISSRREVYDAIGVNEQSSPGKELKEVSGEACHAILNGTERWDF